MTTDTPKCRCLHCGKTLDAVSGINTGDAPSPGSLTVCIRCGAVMVFADDLTVRGMTEKEMDYLCNDTKTMKTLASRGQAIRLMPKLN
jgi:hypothetical protein